MKPRKWVVVVACIIGILGGALYQGVRYVEKKRGLEDFLVQRVRLAMGGSCSIEKVSLGLLTVHLRQVTADYPDYGFHVSIKNINVSISLFELMRTRGDVAKSISRILVNQPVIVFNPFVMHPDTLAKSADEFPLDELVIQNGRFILLDNKNDSMYLGDKLDGLLVKENNALSVKLKGCLASTKKNLSCTGILSPTGVPERISLRLNKARMNKPFTVKGASFTGGEIDGTLELSFKAPFTIKALDLRGTVTLSKASVTIPALPDPFESLMLGVSLNGTTLHIDSCGGAYKDATFRLGGTWDLTDTDSSSFWVSLYNVNPAQYLAPINKQFSSLVSGTAWVTGTGYKRAQSNSIEYNATIGGISLLGEPVLRGHVRGRVLPDKTVLDSARIQTVRSSLLVSGNISYAPKSLMYASYVNLQSDTIPFLTAVHGTVSASASISGDEKSCTYQGTVKISKGMAYQIPLQDLELTVMGTNSMLNFGTISNQSAPLSFSGNIENLATISPQVHASGRLGPPIISKINAAIPQEFKKCIGVREGSFALEAQGSKCKGSLSCTLTDALIGGKATIKFTADSSGFSWNTAGNSIVLSGNPLDFQGVGVLRNDSMRVDSLKLGSLLRAHGIVGTGARPWIDCNVWFDTLGIAELLPLFSDPLPFPVGGYISGQTRISGTLEEPVTHSMLRLVNGSVSELTGFSADAIVQTMGSSHFKILPVIVRRKGVVVFSTDTISEVGMSGKFSDLDLETYAHAFLDPEIALSGMVRGSFTQSNSGPIHIELSSYKVIMGDAILTNLSLKAQCASTGLENIYGTFSDSTRTHATIVGNVPYAFLAGSATETDTLHVALDAQGDFLATIGRQFISPLGGSGDGTLHIEVVATGEKIRFVNGRIDVPKGKLMVEPYIPGGIENFSAHATIDESGKVATILGGLIHKKPATITSVHFLPKGYDPLKIGPLDFGALAISTPKGGIHIHLPGFHEIGDVADVEFAGRSPFPAFTVSGPLDRIKLTGTWLLRSTSFTYPFLVEEKIPITIDPFPFVTWEMDVRVSNPKVSYFWDIRGNKRTLIRFVEGTLDQTSYVTVLGRDKDKTFRLLGGIKSSRGSVFFGKVFDRNFNVSVDFAPLKLSGAGGYDNFPVISGSAEAFSDTSRFNRVQLTLQVTNPQTGGISEKGRIALVPSITGTSGKWRPAKGFDSIPNFIFHLSSDIDELKDDSQRRFFMDAGVRFSSIQGVGSAVTDFGGQFLRRYLLQRFQHNLARSLGLDVVSFESSIASNYFTYLNNRNSKEYSNQWYLLTNMGVTVGRYFFHDYLFLKAQGQFISVDTIVKPEYSVGLEFMPVQNLMFNVSNGFYANANGFTYNPRVQFQLQVPIAPMRKLLDF